MVENLKQIKALAKSTDLFETIRSTSVSDVADFPALLITEQDDPEKQPTNAMHTRYQTGWKYTVNILHKYDNDEDDDFNQEKLESLADAMKALFTGTPTEPGDYLILSEYRGEAMISGSECLACEIIIQKDGREFYA